MSDIQEVSKAKLLRLKELRKHSKLNQSRFAEKIGINQSNYSAIEVGTRTLGKNIEYRILNEFNVNERWWETGEGNMLNPSPDNKSNAQFLGEEDEPLELVKKVDSTEFRSIGDRYIIECPLISQYAYAGYVSGWADEVYVEELPRHHVIVKELSPGIYRAFEVKGDSMDNGLKGCVGDGDIVTARKLNRDYWVNRLHLHKYKNYVLVTKDGILIKEITEHKVEEGIVVCHSLNPDKEAYPDFEVHLEDVNEIFYIKAITERYQ